MHIKNLVSIMDVVVYDWSAQRLPGDYICLEFVVPQEEAGITTQRLRITGAEFSEKPQVSMGGNPGIRITLKNVLSLWVDSLRFWR